jgi:hypothetical protein
MIGGGVKAQSGNVRARFAPGAPQVEVLVSLVLVLGARAGLSVEQIDDFAMALEMLVRHQPLSAREAVLQTLDGQLEVSLSNVDRGWLHERRPMLAVLVAEVGETPTGVRLRVVA